MQQHESVHPDSLWADLDGPVHYVDFGGPEDGPRVVLVHGLGGSYLNWSLVGPTLAQTCRVLALDLPAHGRTPLADRSAAVQAVQRLLHRFLVEVAGAPAILVGNSMGGMITILQAAADPGTVAGAVLIDPALPAGPLTRPDPLVLAAFAGYAVPGVGEAVMRQRRARYTPEQLVAQTLALCCAHPEKVPPDLVAASVALARERVAHPEADAGFLTAARTLLKVLWRPAVYSAAMRSIDVPVLLLHGDRDRLVSIDAARRVAQRHPAWRFEVAHDVGHVPQLEAPEWVLAVIGDWMQNEGSAAAELARAAAATSGT